MVAGFVPPLRTLLISDRALDELPRSELSMVILHEAAHLRRFHVPLRMLTIVPAWLLGAFISRLADGHSWAMATGSAVAIAMTLVTLRIAAIRTEQDADVQACQLAAQMTGSVRDVPTSYEDAANALSSALLRITVETPSARKASWLHPGVSRRIANMQVFATRQTVFSEETTSAAPNAAVMQQT